MRRIFRSLIFGKSPTPRNKKDEKFTVYFVLAILLILALVYFPVVRWVAGIILGLLLLSFLAKLWNRYHKYQAGETYQVEHHCPIDGRMNAFKYPRGEYICVTVICWYCHIPYSRYPDGRHC
jgi:hypothetical protein